MFADRREAGRMLAAHLMKYVGKGAVVLAVPRGGVPVAEEVASALDAEMDLVVPRKVGAPLNEELAIGAVAPDRTFVPNRRAIGELRVPKEYIERAARMESAEISRRLVKYRGTIEPPRVRGKVVIIVDDGLATGYTMKASVRYVRGLGARKVVAAAPVSSEEAARDVGRDADEVVCIETPRGFSSVGEHYESFPQLTDADVVRAMRRRRA